MKIYKDNEIIKAAKYRQTGTCKTDCYIES